MDSIKTVTAGAASRSKNFCKVVLLSLNFSFNTIVKAFFPILIFKMEKACIYA